MRTILKGFMASLLLALIVSDSVSQEVTDNLTTDPENAPFVYEDIRNFVRAHAMLATDADTMGILQQEYLDVGTPGLKMFIEKYDLTTERLIKAIRKHPDDYASLGDMPEWLATKEEPVRRAFTQLKRYIPNVVFPPTYYLIGGYRGIGSGSVEGQLITVEKSANKRGKKKFAPLLVHELVHFQQVVAVGYPKYKALFGPEKSLLGLTIREGTAEFFADLVTGEMTQDEAREFTIAREPELWEQFQKDMLGSETGDWMWQKPSDPEQPRHVAYVLGARIVESYYKNAPDKEKAVREILSVTDYPAFLEKSGYAGQFSGGEGESQPGE
ncbi:MAG: hypothetical protein JSW58_05570 [Candidatus Latescibacterota bacterium]|nr:MAG: hypothetical protein JSW58_05570 [Candidatus Latescibacterota bacterium]